MRAIGVYEFGGPDALALVELPEPEVGPGELGIRVHAATVNPTDTGLRSGARARQLRDVPPPHVPGMEAAGVLERVGAGVSTDLEPGDHVMAIIGPRGAHGAYSEHIAVPAESVVRTPAGASDAEAATLPMNGLTARYALDLLELEPGQRIGVTGSAGTLGGYVVQLAKAGGLEVVADAAAADEELVRSLGADTIVARGADVADRIREVASGGVDGLVDAAVLNEAVAPAVRDGGQVITVRGFEGKADRGVTLRPVWVREYLRRQDKLDELREQVERGELTLRVARVLPAEQAAEAHRLLEAGGTRGRLVLEF